MYKILSLLCLFPLVSLKPSPDPGHVPPHHHRISNCKTEYQTVTSKVCRTVYNKECSTETQQKQITEFEKKCQDIPIKKCRPTTREIEDTKCKTKYNEVCTMETREAFEVSYTEECHQVNKKVCSGHHAFGHIGGHIGKRSADADGGYGCETVTNEVCGKIPVRTPKYEDVPVCSNVPEITCEPSKRLVPDTECEDDTVEKCHQEPVQGSVDVDLETCVNVPTEICEDVEKKVPSTTCSEYKKTD